MGAGARCYGHARSAGALLAAGGPLVTAGPPSRGTPLTPRAAAEILGAPKRRWSQ